MCWRCSGQRPQSHGQPLWATVSGNLGYEGIFGLYQKPKKGLPRHIGVRKGHSLRKTTSLPHSSRKASSLRRHSGQTLCVEESTTSFVIPAHPRDQNHFAKEGPLPFRMFQGQFRGTGWCTRQDHHPGLSRTLFRRTFCCIRPKTIPPVGRPSG